MGVVYGLVPARSAGVDIRLCAFTHSAKDPNGLGPDHAEGTQFGNLKEEVGAGRKAEPYRSSGAIDIHFARLHFSKEVDCGSESEPGFLHSGRSRFFKFFATY